MPTKYLFTVNIYSIRKYGRINGVSNKEIFISINIYLVGTVQTNDVLKSSVSFLV